MTAVLLVGCSHQQKGSDEATQKESSEAKSMMQGVWIDSESEEVAFRVKGDSIFYADSTSMPAYFKIVGDSLLLGSGVRYAIEKQTEHLFWFRNPNGDLVKYEKSDDADDAAAFVHEPPKIMTYTHQVKSDSTVLFDGNRYHWYIAINPTKYKVHTTAYNNDGVEVDNVYYDNIMHVSLFKGANKFFSRDFRKQDYAQKVPEQFLTQSVLSNMEFSGVDEKGFRFVATICIPDGATCYKAENRISFDGKLTTTLIEY